VVVGRGTPPLWRPPHAGRSVRRQLMVTVEATRFSEPAQGSAPCVRLPLFLGVVLLGIGLFHTHLYYMFTPVYTSTECGNITATLDDFRVGARSIDIRIMIKVNCKNPNPYQITILDTSPGRVWVGRMRQNEVGNLAVQPGSVLHAMGTGQVKVLMNAHVSGSEADSLVPHFLEDAAVPVLMQLQFDAGIFIKFSLGSFSTTAPFKKNCGLNMAGLLVNQFLYVNQSRLGPLVCRETFDGMQIPSVGAPQAVRADGSVVHDMGFSAAQVAPTEVSRGEMIKTLSLGTVMALSFFFGGLFLTYGSLAAAGKSPKALLAQSPLGEISKMVQDRGDIETQPLTSPVELSVPSRSRAEDALRAPLVPEVQSALKRTPFVPMKRQHQPSVASGGGRSGERDVKREGSSRSPSKDKRVAHTVGHIGRSGDRRKEEPAGESPSKGIDSSEVHRTLSRSPSMRETGDSAPVLARANSARSRPLGEANTVRSTNNQRNTKRSGRRRSDKTGSPDCSPSKSKSPPRSSPSYTPPRDSSPGPPGPGP